MFKKIHWLWSHTTVIYLKTTIRSFLTLAWNENGGLDKIRVCAYEIFTLPAFKTFCNLSLCVPETPFKITGDRQRTRHVLDNTLQGPPAQGCVLWICVLLSAVTETHSAIRLSKEELLHSHRSRSLCLHSSLRLKLDFNSLLASSLPVKYLRVPMFMQLYSSIFPSDIVCSEICPPCVSVPQHARTFVR